MEHKGQARLPGEAEWPMQIEISTRGPARMLNHSTRGRARLRSEEWWSCRYAQGRRLCRRHVDVHARGYGLRKTLPKRRIKPRCPWTGATLR